MKTHELSKSLMFLARLLREMPNMELPELVDYLPWQRRMLDKDRIAVNLATLASLSRIDKRQWLELIDDYRLPIPLRERDATRDIMGKVLRYLETHPDAIRSLSSRVGKGKSEASPELMKALSILIKD